MLPIDKAQSFNFDELLIIGQTEGKLDNHLSRLCREIEFGGEKVAIGFHILKTTYNAKAL